MGQDITNRNRRLNGPFISLIFWWLSARDYRSDIGQLKLFSDVKFDSPYCV